MATKKKVKSAKDKPVDVVEIIEEEEAKRAKAKAKPSADVKKKLPIKDTTADLPENARNRKIVCKEVSEVEVLKVDIADITATSKTMYVDNIHSANPVIMQTIYWITMPDTRHVVARVTKEEYEYVVGQLKKASHLVSVVDCAVTPTLTYGSWKISELKGELPSPDQIEMEDKKFKDNPTSLHNPPVAIELMAEEEVASAAEEEDEWGDWDDEDENEEETVSDDDEF